MKPPLHSALVTGGSRGIGAAIAQRLRHDGFRIVVLDRIAPEHDAVDAFHEVDLADAQATFAAAEQAASAGHVTRFVHNAGIVRPASVSETREADFDTVMAINLRAAITITRALLPGMREAGVGRIVTIASRAALGKELRSAYAASKAGLIGLVKTWALELGREGITANAVGPGPIATALFEAANPPDAPATKRIREAIPVARMGTADDVANAVSFFCDERAGFVTGQVLYVCGGMTVGAASH